VGSWGVTTRESDYGLDLLTVANDRYLRGVKFKTFHVKHITELLRSHIIGEFVKESNGWETHYIDFFYDYTFPYHYAHAVILIAECFTEYRNKGNFLIYDYKAAKKRRIVNFIFTNEDLRALRSELQSILDPKHSLYESWQNSDYFNEWQAHIQMLCDTLLQAMTEGGDGNA